MVYRKMLYFHWMLITSLVHQAMYTAGAIDTYDQMIKNGTLLPILALNFYHIVAYQVISLC
jgi:hypothetical protein